MTLYDWSQDTLFSSLQTPLTRKSSYDWGPKGHLALQNHCRRLAPPFGSLRAENVLGNLGTTSNNQPRGILWMYGVSKWGWPLILLVILIGNNDHKWNQQWPGSQICGTTTPPNVHGLTPIKISFSCMLYSSIKIRMPRNFGADLRFTKCCPHFEASRPTFFRSSSGSSPRWYQSRCMDQLKRFHPMNPSSFLSSWLFFFSVFFPSSAHSGTCPRRYLTGSTSWQSIELENSQTSWPRNFLGPIISWLESALCWVL